MKILSIRLHERTILRAEIIGEAEAVDLKNGCPISLHSTPACLFDELHIQVLEDAGTLTLSIGAGGMQELEIVLSAEAPSGVEIIDETGNRYDLHEASILALLSPEQRNWLKS